MGNKTEGMDHDQPLGTGCRETVQYPRMSPNQSEVVNSLSKSRIRLVIQANLGLCGAHSVWEVHIHLKVWCTSPLACQGLDFDGC